MNCIFSQVYHFKWESNDREHAYFDAVNMWLKWIRTMGQHRDISSVPFRIFFRGIWTSQNDYLSLLDRLFFQTRSAFGFWWSKQLEARIWLHWSFYCAINQCWLIQRSQINSVHWKNEDVHYEITLAIQMKQQHFIREKWVNIPFVFASNEAV